MEEQEWMDIVRTLGMKLKAWLESDEFTPSKMMSNSEALHSTDDPFTLIIQGSPDCLITFGESMVAVRIMGHLNHHLCYAGFLLPLVNRRFYLGQDVYRIFKTEGIVGFPERMAVMATAVREG